MKMPVILPEAELNALYNEYVRQSGKRTREEVAEVLAQDIIDRYFSPEHYDQFEIRTTIDSLIDS